MKTAISSRLYFGIELSFFGLSTERRISIWNSSEDDLLSKMHIKSIVSDLKLSFILSIFTYRRIFYGINNLKNSEEEIWQNRESG